MIVKIFFESTFNVECFFCCYATMNDFSFYIIVALDLRDSNLVLNNLYNLCLEFINSLDRTNVQSKLEAL